MNVHELYLYSLVVIHVFIWLYLFFAWTFSKIHVFVILIVLLPMVYIAQSLPCHALIYLKLKYIIKHKHSFKYDPNSKLSKSDLELAGALSKSLSWDVKDIEDAILRLKYYDEKMIITEMICNLKDWLDDKCFVNPLSAQGLLIIAFIINTIALVLKYRISPKAICYSKK